MGRPFFAAAFICAVVMVSTNSIVTGLNLPISKVSNPLKTLATKNAADSTLASKTMPLAQMNALLSCFGLPTLTEVFTEILTDPENIYKNAFLNGSSNANQVASGDFSNGYYGNGKICEGNAWIGNATMGSPTCLVNGDQTFVNGLVLQGNQTVLCGNLQDGYVQYLNGLLKLKMSNSAEEPFNGWIQLGPLSRMQMVVNRQGIFASFQGINVNILFPGDVNNNNVKENTPNVGSLVFA